jgi:hypothetical protein
MTEKSLTGVKYSDIPKIYVQTPSNSPITPLLHYQRFLTGLTANNQVAIDFQPNKIFMLKKILLMINAEPAEDLVQFSDGLVTGSFNHTLAFDYVGEKPTTMLNLDFIEPIAFWHSIKLYMSSIGNTYRVMVIGYIQEKASLS